MSNIDRDAEIELLKQKLQDKDDLIKSFMRTEDHLVPLPNGDLHRGMRNRVVNANIDVEAIPDNAGNPLDRAMAKILTAAKGGHNLVCLWCGLSYDGANSEKSVREHLKTDHASVVEGWDSIKSEVLMANLADANARLEAANAS